MCAEFCQDHFITIWARIHNITIKYESPVTNDLWVQDKDNNVVKVFIAHLNHSMGINLSSFGPINAQDVNLAITVPPDGLISDATMPWAGKLLTTKWDINF